MFDDILFIISMASIFFNGFCFRRKYMIGLLASVLFAQIPIVANIYMMGVHTYLQHIVNADKYTWIYAAIYFIFLWVLGYILGGFGLSKIDNEDFPGKTAAKYTRLVMRKE